MSSRQTGQDFVNIFTPFPAGRDQFFPPLPSLCLSLSLSSPLPFQRFASHNAPERTNEVKYGSLVETNERPSKRYFHYLRINKFSVFRRPTQPRYIFFFWTIFDPAKFQVSSFTRDSPPLPSPSPSFATRACGSIRIPASASSYLVTVSCHWSTRWAEK